MKRNKPSPICPNIGVDTKVCFAYILLTSHNKTNIIIQMPFTFSHPAIILPLKFLPRRWFSLTGLVIGSMAPDFEYFLRMKTQSDYSHTIAGIFWFDLPLGILLAFTFHNIVRNSLFKNLPSIFKSRLLNFNEFNWNQYFKLNWSVVIISILVGTASHIFWDGFTHQTGYFVNEIPSLRKVLEVSNLQIPVFKILQHLSTIVGAIIILFAVLKLPIIKHDNQVMNAQYWMILLIITLVIITLRIFTGLNIKLYGYVIVSLISAILISLIITPLLYKLTAGNST